ncbi:MAG: alkyl sulfatase dimerization domain-containing protein [Dehalococcoidia bacterium]
MQENKYEDLVSNKGEGNLNRKAEGILERKKGPMMPGKIEVHKVTDNIRVVQCGADAHLSYITWVITDEGVVVIDTGMGEVSSLVNEDIARETGLPVKYIIYTHGHVDHAFSATPFMVHNPEIIAHENIFERVKRYELVGDYIRKITPIQFNPAMRMPESIPADSEPPFPMRAFVPPTITYRDEYKSLSYDPDYALGGDLIIVSKQKIKEVFEENIELLRYLQDSVVKAINEGKNLEQITEEVQLPSHLENSPNLTQTYSRREFAIYNIFKRYCGYFDFSPTSLLPRPKREIGEVVRNLVGSDKAIINEADRLMHDGQLQLALETLDLILKPDYENVPARRKRMEVLRKLADIDICLMSRNAFIYYMLEDERFLASNQ